MPPQCVQRRVQYSAPARPGMMRSSAREASQSGQLDIAGGEGGLDEDGLGLLGITLRHDDDLFPIG